MDEPFAMRNIFSIIAVEIEDPKSWEMIKVNGQWFKLFLEFYTNEVEDDMVLHESQYLEWGNKLFILYKFLLYLSF